MTNAQCPKCGHAAHTQKCLVVLRTGKPGEDIFCLCEQATGLPQPLALTSRDERIQSLERDNAALRERLRELGAFSLEGSLDTLDRQLDIVAERDRLHEQVERLTAQHKHDALAFAGQQGQLEDLVKQNATLRQQVSRLEDQFAILRAGSDTAIDTLATRCRELEAALKRVYTMATSQLAEPVDEDTGTLAGIATIVEELELRDAAMKGAKP